MMLDEKPDFDKELVLGSESYSRKVGRWWCEQARDAAHVYAYKKIANQVRSLVQKKSPLILDYGCGSGDILIRLHRLVPDCKILGIDGSSFMLDLAKKRLARSGGHLNVRVKMLQTKLPNFSLLQGQADIVVYAFPNIISDGNDARYYGRKFKGDAKVARLLSMPGGGNSREGKNKTDHGLEYDHFFMDRVISRNLHGLLKKGGICVRVEYGTPDAEEVSDLDVHRSTFEDGSLNETVAGLKPERYFKEEGWTFYRSKVILDVYDQTEDEANQKGGFYITTLKAL